MSKNKCTNCSYDLKEDWNFCPRCGAEIPKWYDKLNYGLDKVLMKVAEDIKNLLFGGMIEISFNQLPFPHTPHPSSNTHQNKPTHKKMNDLYKKWDIKEVKEPALKYNEKPNQIEVEVITPPIKKESDAHITVNKESIEVRVYDSDKKTLYFKLINIPAQTKIINKKIENNHLKIIFVKGGMHYSY